MLKLILIVLILTPQNSSVYSSQSLLLLHNGDMHSHFEEFSDRHGIKIGGFARIRTTLEWSREVAKSKHIIPLYLNSGDTMGGSLWYKVYGWEIAADFMRLLRPNVMSLGAHEFDQSVRNLSRYIKAVGCPVVCTNGDFSKEPILARLIKRSYTFIFNNIKIGVVGYLTPETKYMMNIGKVKLFSEITSLKNECNMLKDKGVNLIIALGHSGYRKDLYIANEVTDIDIVVGGYSHSLLWKGDQPHTDIPIETYPKVVNQRNGKRALILHAGSNTKYLGRILLHLNHQGIIKNYRAGPLFMKNSISQDREALNLLNRYRKKVDEYRKKVIGVTFVLLSNSCTKRECNFGNMITDAFVDYMASKRTKNDTSWSKCGIAILNGGAIRSSIHPGNITIEHIYNALPTYQRLVSFDMQGRDIVKLLEWSVQAEFHPKRNEFLQISGFRVMIDPEITTGERIVYIKVRCTDCVIPKLVGLVLTGTYRLLTTEYLLNGNAGYRILYEKSTNLRFHKVYDFDIVVKYLKIKKLVRPEVNERFFYMDI